MKKKKRFLLYLNLLLTIIILTLVIVINIKNQENRKEHINVVNQNNEYNVNDEENMTDDSKIVVDSENNQENSNNDDENENNNSSDNGNTSNDTIENVSTDDKEFEMVFAGDFYFSDYVLNKYNANGISGVLSKELQQLFIDADIAMVNEEFPFSNKGTPMKDKQFTFRVDPKYVSLFKDIGIDIATLANNHILDFGEEALLESLSTLRDASIKYVGAGKDIEEAKEISEFTFGDKTVSIVGASRVIPVTDWNATNDKAGLLTTYDPTTLVTLIKEAKLTSDIVVVYVHWGIERKTRPESYQRELAKQYIDAGADIIIGSHPHVLQGIEYYNNKPIIYSLGNFMFYNSIDKTALIKVKIESNNNIKLSIVPCKAVDAYTSEIIKKQEKNEFYDYIEDLSYGIDIDQEGNITNSLTH